MPRDRSWNEPTLSPTDVVRQHVVPRMYLAHFSTAGRIEACDLQEDTQFDGSVRDVAVRTGFYDVRIERRTLSTESWLAAVEGAAAAIIRVLADDPNKLLTLSNEDEQALSRFVCAQMLRVQAFREADAAMREQLLQGIKEMTKSWLDNTAPSKEVAKDLWEFWQGKPDEWWFHENEPYQPARTTAFMLGEVPGFANVLRAMPWRIGLVDGGSFIYTSDSALSRHRLPTVRWANFAMWWYILPLTPSILLQIGPRLADKGQPKRIRKDYSPWETSFARHVVTENASRFLYGPGPYVSRECALACLKRIDLQQVRDAVWLQGYDPGRPF